MAELSTAEVNERLARIEGYNVPYDCLRCGLSYMTSEHDYPEPDGSFSECGPAGYAAPDYCRSLDAQQPLWEMLRERHFTIRISDRCCDIHRHSMAGWECLIVNEKNKTYMAVQFDTASEAAARATLQALEAS